MRALTPLAAFAALMAAGPAAAHVAHAPAEGFAWTFDAWIVGPLAIALGLFTGGWVRLRARSGTGLRRLMRRAYLFVAGWLLLAGALVSPLHQAGEHSFTAHMIEHELLMLAAAPLLVLSEPLAVMLWAFPAAGRRTLGGWGHAAPIGRMWRLLTEPVTATAIQAAALWLWHAPALFGAALASEGWHVAQHLSFLVSALLFWTAVTTRRPRNHGLAAICLFATSLISGALGAMMAFSTSPWYAGYSQLGLAPFGLTPMEDQQLAGMLMWVPGGLVHAGAALAAVAAALAALRQEASHAT